MLTLKHRPQRLRQRTDADGLVAILWPHLKPGPETSTVHGHPFSATSAVISVQLAQQCTRYSICPMVTPALRQPVGMYAERRYPHF